MSCIAPIALQKPPSVIHESPPVSDVSPSCDNNNLGDETDLVALHFL